MAALLRRISMVFVLWLVCIFGLVRCPPVELPSESEKRNNDLEDAYMELNYKKYLQEVVSALEGDKPFKDQLDKMEHSKNDVGDVAKYLSLASKGTRTKLDELKRVEMQRLKGLHRSMMLAAAEAIRASAGNVPNIEELPKIDMDHIDEQNPHSFEMEDLQKLINKTTNDLLRIDKKRKEEFKQYEMKKELKFRDELQHLDQQQAEDMQKKHDESVKRHGEHPPLNYPGHRQQLEEVWKEGDQLQPEHFNTKTLFKLHDLDGDGYLSIEEVEALFQTELDKLYNASNPDDDMVERHEEMNRMREQFFTENDLDHDGFVSWAEFLAATKSANFTNNEPWKGLDVKPVFSEQELTAFQAQLDHGPENKEDLVAQAVRDAYDEIG